MPELEEKKDWKVTALIGAIAGLIIAATPGIVGLLDNTAERAKIAAAQSTQDAQKSQEMTNLAYELLREKLSSVDSRLNAFDKLLDNLSEDVAELKMKRTRTPGRVSGLVGAGGGAASGADVSPPPPPPSPPVQKLEKLPANLEEAWKKAQ